MRGVYRTWRFTNPLNNLRPIEHEMPTKIENRHRVWTSAANFLAHPRHVGVQTTGDLFNRNKLVGSHRHINYGDVLVTHKDTFVIFQVPRFRRFTSQAVATDEGMSPTPTGIYDCA